MPPDRSPGYFSDSRRVQEPVVQEIEEKHDLDKATNPRLDVGVARHVDLPDKYQHWNLCWKSKTACICSVAGSAFL